MGQILFAVKARRARRCTSRTASPPELKNALASGLLDLLFIPLSFTALLAAGAFGIVVLIRFIYMIWKLAVFFREYLMRDFFAWSP
jgi:hypothetical protein